MCRARAYGLIVNVCDRLVVPADTVIVTTVGVVTARVTTVSDAPLVAGATVTVGGTVTTDGEFVVTVTTNPPAGAFPCRPMLPVTDPPPMTVVELSAKDESAGANRVSCVVAAACSKLAPKETATLVATGVGTTETLATAKPAGIVNEGGTGNAVFELLSATINPPAGAT